VLEGPRIAVGSWRTTRAAIERVFGDAAAEEGFLERYRDEELLFQSALATGALPEPDVAYLEALAGDSTLVALIEERARARFVPPTREQLAARFEALGAGAPRLQRRLGLDLLRVTFPPDVEPLAFHDEVAALAERLAGGAVAWSAAPASLAGARIESRPVESVLEIAGALGPDLFDRIKQLRVGEVSAPLKDGVELVLVRVREEQPARPLSFEEALPRLTRAWLVERNEELTRQITEELLSGASFRLTAEGRARIEGGLAP
jgi:hypothetical protein